MDDDYLYDAYAGHEKTNFSRTEFESEFLTFPNGCSASGGALAGDRPAVTVRCDGEECRSCKPNAVLQALADGSEASTYPLLLYASSARRIRRAFGHDEHDILPHLKKMLDPAKPTVLVSLPNMAWGSTSREFWVYDALYAQLGQLKSNFNVMVRAHPLDTIVPGLLPGFDVTAMVWSWPLVEMADIVVGRPNGVVCSATHVPDKTLLVVSDYPKAAQEQLQAQAEAYMIGDASARMIYSNASLESEVREAWTDREHNETLADGHGLLTAVGRSSGHISRRRRYSDRDAAAAARRQGRADFFATRQGCIDGYED
jgi:hypothetical protein